MLNKKSPLKHRERAGEDHSTLTAGEHWDKHPFAKDKPGFKGTPVSRPKAKVIPTAEEEFFGGPELDYKGERIDEKKEVVDTKDVDVVETSKQLFYRSVEDFNKNIQSGKIKVKPPAVKDENQLNKKVNSFIVNGTPVVLERDNVGDYTRPIGLLPGSDEDKKITELNNKRKNIKDLKDDYINSNKVKTKVVYDQNTQQDITVADYGDPKRIQKMNDDIFNDYLQGNKEFEQIRTSVLKENDEYLNKAVTEIKGRASKKYDLEGLEDRLLKKWDVATLREDMWNEEILPKHQATIDKRQAEVNERVMASLMEGVNKGKYEGYSQEELQRVYEEQVSKEMEPILQEINTTAGNELTEYMSAVMEEVNAEYGDIYRQANEEIQNEFHGVTWGVIQDDPRFQELAGEFYNELNELHLQDENDYVVDQNTWGIFKMAQKGYDAAGLYNFPVFNVISPYQVYLGGRKLGTSVKSAWTATKIEQDYGLRHSRHMKNLHASQNENWSDDQEGYVNSNGDFMKWGDDEREEYGVSTPWQIRRGGGYPYADYKKEAQWGTSRDEMAVMVDNNNKEIARDYGKIFERRNIEGAYDKGDMHKIMSGNLDLREISLMVSEQAVNIVSAIGTFGLAPAIQEGSGVYEQLIQDAAREKFGLGPDQMPTKEQLLEVANDDELHDRISETSKVSGIIMGGLEYVGAKQVVKPFFKNIKNTGVSLIRGQYKRFLQSGAAAVSGSTAGGFTESITEGLQTVVSSTATGHWSTEEFFQAIGQGGVVGFVLPFGGNVIKQSARELSAIYKIASGKLNKNSAEAYFNGQFKKLEAAFKAGNITEKDYEDKSKAIVEVRNANKKVPDDVEGKTKQEVIELLVEKEQIESKIKDKDESLTKGDQERIDQIKVELTTKAELDAAQKRLDQNIKLTETLAERIPDGEVLTIKEKDGGTARVVELAKEAGIKEDVSRADGFVLPGTNKVVINYEVAKATEAVSVGSHELFHAIMRNSLRGKDGRITSEGWQMIDNFADDLFISDPDAYAIVQDRIDRNYRFNEDGTENPAEDYAEEYFNIFHDAIIKKQIKPKNNTLKRIGSTFVDLFKGKGFSNINFDETKDGRDVYNFIVDYSRDVQRGMEGKGTVRQEIIDLATKGRDIASKAVYSKTVQKAKDNLNKLDYRNNEGEFSKEKFLSKPIQSDVIAELPGMIDAQISNLLISSNLDKERWGELRQEAIFGLYEKGEIDGDNTWDGRGTLYGFLNGRIKYRLKDAFKNNPTIVQDFSQEELDEAMTQLDEQDVGIVTLDEDLTDTDTKRTKVNVLQIGKIASKQDDIIKAVNEKGDFREVIDNNTGEVGSIIFGIPENKIANPQDNITTSDKIINPKTGKKVKKGETGIPERSEATNIQDFFANTNATKKFIQILNPTNVTEKDADINKLGENIEVSREVYGRAIGLPNRILKYFYQPKIKEDGKRQRSQGLTSQVPMWGLKPEFNNLSDTELTKAAEQFQKDLGITEKQEVNKLPTKENRSKIGQLLKGAAVVISQQASISAAVRKKARLLRDANVKKKEAIKKQMADIAAAQSKVAFSFTDKLGQVDPEFEMDGVTHVDFLLGSYDKDGIFRHRSSTEIDNLFTSFENDIIPNLSENIMPKSTLRSILRPSRRIFPGKRYGFEGKGKDKIIIEEGKHKGKEMTIYDYFDFKINELLAKDLNYGAKLEGDGAKYVYGRTYGSIFGENEKAIAKSTEGELAREFNKIHSSMHRQLWQRINKSIKDTKGESASAWGSWLGLVGQNTEHPHRMGAEYLGFSENAKGHQSYKKDGSKGKFKLYEWEHAMPATKAYLYLLSHSLSDVENNTDNFNIAYDLVMKNFKVIALDAAMNRKFSTAKRGTGMGEGWSIMTGSWLDRYFDEIMAAIDGGIDPATIKGPDGRSFAEIYNINAEGKPRPLKVGISQSKTLNQAIQQSRTTKPTRGMSAWDMDDTLARTKSGVRASIPNPDGTPKPGRKVIFLAGGAGSGKSNVVKQLDLEEQGFKIVNQDISLEWLKKNHGLPENMNDLTKEQASLLGKLGWEARKIAARKKMKFQGNGDGIVVDGTGASLNVMNKQVQEFKDAGYDVQMIFVETSLDVALERNRARKERSLKDIIVRKNHEAVQGNKDAFKKLFGKNFAGVNTDKLKQNDPMPSALVKKLDKFTKSYEKRRLTAEEFAIEGAGILQQGGEFDFTEFDKIVEGEKGPLFGKAMDRAKKYGLKDQFIITARPHAAKVPIYEFLKSQGLEIPLKNIITLENSTSEAKALWIADKVGEGYNDIYFADDALQNVQAVENMLKQFDVKGKVQQAKVQFSKSMNDDFNNILEDVTGIESKKRFSAIKARKRGASKGKFRFFIPPSHEDFVGLLYNFMGKGEKGNQHRDFFEQTLVKPLNRAYRELNTAKQSIANDYRALNKQFPDIKKKLTKKTPDGDFTNQDAIRIYLWNRHGHKVPGLSETDQARLTEFVMSDPELQAYAEALNVISKQDAYVNPTQGWEAGDIRTDLDDATGRVGREQYFTEFWENADIIFSKENLNKIEAAYGEGVREALQDILYRTKTGRNRPVGNNKLVNGFLNYLNGSVGATMFFNIRSSVLQQMSMVNFINFADNNIYAAGKAFANQPQYWKDWATIFNSDFMKQRRGGIKTDVDGAELAASLRGAKNTPRALIAKLLELGFLPTQIGDNIAIANGGSTYYRNRINTYLKQGLSQKEAESRAWTDFQILAEATQQSARPDMVSQQQASPLGRLILAFQNVTSQFNRLGKKAFLDVKNRRISPEYKNASNPQLQSDISNLSRMTYYFVVQNLVFYSLQSALFMMMFDDDEEDERWLKKKERMINGSIDSVLRGTGVWGAVIATLKNMAIKWHEQRDKGWNKDESAVLMEMLNVSPPLGIKARKMVNAEKTLNYNKSVIKEMETLDLDNPMWSAVTSYIEAVTNVPVNRLYNKTQNVRESLDNQHGALKRALMFSGWSKWNLGIGDSEKIIEVKETVKEKKKAASKEKAKIKREEKKKTELIQKEEEGEKKQEQQKKEGKTVTCLVCKLPVVKGKKYCTIHEEVKQNETGKKVQCKKVKSDKSRCKMQTSSKSGYCYYHD